MASQCFEGVSDNFVMKYFFFEVGGSTSTITRKVTVVRSGGDLNDADLGECLKMRPD